MTILLDIYPEGHPVRTAVAWATDETELRPVNATVLVEELERMVLAHGARMTQINRALAALDDRWGHADAPYEPVALHAMAILRGDENEA